MTCLDCDRPATLGSDLCETCRLLELDERADANSELASARDEGDILDVRGFARDIDE